MVAEQVEAERLVFVDEMGTNISPALLCRAGLPEESGRYVRCRATEEQTQPSFRA
jgi:hypothetical protein